MATHDYKVLITTSGVGQKLGEFTKYTNKALVRIGKKPAISYIIENYPDDIPIVVTLGYYGQHVRDFLELAYPDRKFEFVEVENYDGPGSSLGYSLLQAKDNLQCPFIFQAADTMVVEEIPKPDSNWIGGNKKADPSQYGSWKMINDKPTYSEKGALEFDYIHMGLVGIHDYEKFWTSLAGLYKKDPNYPLLNDTKTITDMIESGSNFEMKEFKKWFDISNVVAYHHAKKYLGEPLEVYEKVEESIYLFDDKFIIKFFHNKDIVTDRVKRAQALGPLVPKILDHRDNFYKYEYVKGELYSEAITPEDFKSFLTWSKTNLWKPSKAASDEELKKICLDFYKTKTLKRLGQFYEQNSLEDQEHIINGIKVPKVETMLESIDWDKFTTPVQTGFHGDFIPENIIKTEDGYILLDWRQNFGGLIESGDIYYDLGKLNHNMVVERYAISNNLFQIKIEGNDISCDIYRRHKLVECQKILMDFIKQEGFDQKKTEMLTGIIWLNMSPLHHHPFNLFLFFFGKLYLWKALNLPN